VCHQSIGLIARHLEAAGFPTIGLTSARTITAAANPPRAVFVDLPLGHTAGPPNDPESQRTIVTSALEAGAAMTEPGIVDLPIRWKSSDWKKSPMSWSRAQEDAGAAGQYAGDTRIPRSADPQWQLPEDEERASRSAS
jgi:hypothetical protein